MKKSPRSRAPCALRVGALLVLCGVLQVAATARAHEGEVHKDPAAAAAHASAEPRFEARGDAIEVTGILKAGNLWLFVTRYATNEPWAGLRIGIEGGDTPIAADVVAAGIYRAKAGTLTHVGRHAVVLTLRGEGLDELLAAELVVPTVAA